MVWLHCKRKQTDRFSVDTINSYRASLEVSLCGALSTLCTNLNYIRTIKQRNIVSSDENMPFSWSHDLSVHFLMICTILSKNLRTYWLYNVLQLLKAYPKSSKDLSNFQRFKINAEIFEKFYFTFWSKLWTFINSSTKICKCSLILVVQMSFCLILFTYWCCEIWHWVC